MIYTFRVVSDECDDFFMDIEIKSNQTFFDLHSIIQYETEWDPSHLACFYVSDDSWLKNQDIALIDISGSSLLMDKTKLSKFYKAEKQKLIYQFDMLNDRSLYLQLVSIKDLEDDDTTEYPQCTNCGGSVPSQLPVKKGKAPKVQEFDDFDGFENNDNYENPGSSQDD